MINLTDLKQDTPHNINNYCVCEIVKTDDLEVVLPVTAVILPPIFEMVEPKNLDNMFNKTIDLMSMIK